jgi:dephospho-CoA kinase
MLRVGLTGGLGAGKSTVAGLFAERGAVVLSSDSLGRELMEPGTAVYQAIVARFGREVMLPGGALDRPALAHAAFANGGIERLNAIVHPAVIAEQEARLRTLPADAVAIIESALIFETKFAGPSGWRDRFDRLILVTAPESLKIERFLERARATTGTRAALEADAHRRLAAQMPDAEKIPLCDYVIHNDADLANLEAQVERIWQQLRLG